MSDGRKTKSGTHYNYVDRRKAAVRSLKVGTAQAAKEYGVSETSIKGWRKMYGLDTEAGYGGSMDRYFCKRCKHGCGKNTMFTGCSYLLHTGEKRPHKNGWCLGFCPRDGTKPSVVERYRKETKKHTGEESEDDHMDTAIEPKDIDKAIQDKANRHTQGIRYSKEEKLRILEVYDVHNMIKTCDYFGISPSTIRDWHKRRGEIKAMRPTKEEVAADTKEMSTPVYRKLTPEDVPNVTEIPAEVVQAAAETVENADDKQRDTWDEYIAEQLKAHIAMHEGQAERYRRMLRILEGEA